MAASARTPVLPEATHVGALSARAGHRRSSVTSALKKPHDLAQRQPPRRALRSRTLGAANRQSRSRRCPAYRYGTGAHLRAEDFDHDRGDLLATEDDIVTRLARTLQIRLTDVGAAKLQRSRPADGPDVQELTLRCQGAYLSARGDTLRRGQRTVNKCRASLAIRRTGAGKAAGRNMACVI
jgi:hypothetical protein